MSECKVPQPSTLGINVEYTRLNFWDVSLKEINFWRFFSLSLWEIVSVLDLVSIDTWCINQDFLLDDRGTQMLWWFPLIVLLFFYSWDRLSEKKKLPTKLHFSPGIKQNCKIWKQEVRLKNSHVYYHNIKHDVLSLLLPKMHYSDKFYRISRKSLR